MNCQKCGSLNVNEEYICLDCGYKQKRQAKNEHIDIIDYKVDNKNARFNKMRKRVFNAIIIVLILSIVALIGLFGYFLRAKTSVRIMNEFNDLRVNSPLLVAYINSNDENDEMINKYAEYYDFDYIRIDSNLLTRENRRNLKTEFDEKKISNLMIIYKNSKKIAKKKITNEDEITAFLNDNKVIPNIIENPISEIEKLENIDKNESATLIYIPFAYNELVESKEETLKSLCKQYEITYQNVKGYLFSDKQIIKYINQFGYTEMKNELIIVMENGEVKKTYEQSFLTNEEYVEIFQNYDIISSINDYLTYIDINEFKTKVDSGLKEVFVFGVEDNKYCDNVKYSLGVISKKYNIKINYIDIKETDDISSELTRIGYTGTITYPFTIVVENGKVLDYVIGDSEEKYFVTFLTKLGIIR